MPEADAPPFDSTAPMSAEAKAAWSPQPLPPEPERPKVRVACSVPNGLAIRLFKVGYDDGTGHNPMIWDGPGIRLNGPSALQAGTNNTTGELIEPGITDVDAEWWGLWLTQNAQNPFVGERMVYEFKPEPGEPGPYPESQPGPKAEGPNPTP